MLDIPSLLSVFCTCVACPSFIALAWVVLLLFASGYLCDRVPCCLCQSDPLQQFWVPANVDCVHAPLQQQIPSKLAKPKQLETNVKSW